MHSIIHHFGAHCSIQVAIILCFNYLEIWFEGKTGVGGGGWRGGGGGGGQVVCEVRRG